jgi:nucleoside-diphosphate-sugar epimerase
MKLSENSANSVVVVDNFVRGERDALYEKLILRHNVEEFTTDLSNMDQVKSLPTDIDYLFHMAALNGTENFYTRPFDVLRHCTLPTMHLLEHFGPVEKLRRFVYAGTSEAYASTVSDFGWEVPTAEDVPLAITDVFNARWSYGASKLHGEIATVSAATNFSMPFTIIRYHNAYGPRMGDKHVIPDFLERAKRNIFELHGYDDTRSFIYVDDAVQATIGLAFSERAAGQVVNVGGADEIRIEDLGKLMMKIVGARGELKLFPSPSGSVKRRAAKLEKLQSILGYRPSWSLEAGLRETAAYYLRDTAPV